jgi:hypothetical protein
MAAQPLVSFHPNSGGNAVAKYRFRQEPRSVCGQRLKRRTVLCAVRLGLDKRLDVLSNRNR